MEHSEDTVRQISRRRFLGEASCAAISSTALFSTLMNLRMASTAAAQSVPLNSDYKALVCVFLGGGNDSYNMLVPQGEDEYASYAAIRETIALPRESLLPINPSNDIGMNLGLHPSMPEIQSLFNQGNCALLANVGTLLAPTTKTDYQNNYRLPRGLFSHSDQSQQWQTSLSDASDGLGWGGRTADLINSLNADNGVSMNISMSGNNVWQSGQQAFPYAASRNGTISLRGYDGNYGLNGIRGSAIDSMAAQEYQNLFEASFAKMTKRAFDAHELFSSALDGAPSLATTLPDTNLGNDLEMVLRTVSANSALGARRQTFFVEIGGWDHHDDVLGNQEAMLAVVSQALGAFYAGLEELGLENNVTTFTASDFGRTLTSNGRGTDHAWGGNHIVLGGAVNGQQVYGQYPELVPDGDADVGRGRIIPTTSCDEYFAELALWFGVEPGELATVLPNIGRFYNPSAVGPLGFLSS